MPTSEEWVNKFKTITHEERETIHGIVSRAMDAQIYLAEFEKFEEFDLDEYEEIELDICLVHLHCPLRLADLLAADEFDFAHDMSGIYLTARLTSLNIPFCHGLHNRKDNQ